MSRRIAAIIVAAGEGSRLGGDVPKQFQEVEGRPMLVHSLVAFEAHPLITDITLVLPGSRIEEVETYRQLYGLRKIIEVVEGGRYRRDSVRVGMEAAAGLEPWPDDALIAVHDGARPLLSLDLLSRVLEAAVEFGAAVPVLDVGSTVVEVDPDGGWGTPLDRSQLRLVQTPQVFRADWLLEAHGGFREDDATDDAQMVHATGYPIRLVQGDVMNIKVTHSADLEMVRLLIKGEGA